MSVAVAIILIVVFAVALVGGLAFVMSRPSRLRPHQPDRRRVWWWRARTRGGRADVRATPPDGPTSSSP